MRSLDRAIEVHSRENHQPLAELHVHFQGCIRPSDLLRHLANCNRVEWEWYEEGMKAAYGFVPPARELVERFRAGDETVTAEFEEIAVFGDAHAGNFARFGAKGNLFWAGMHRGKDASVLEREAAGFAAGIRADLVQQGVTYAELRRSDWCGVSALPHLFLMKTFDNDRNGPIRRIAASLSREDPWPEWEQVKALTLGPHGRVLTGVDFCGLEEGHPPKKKAEFFAEVHAFNAAHPESALAILYHVGESFSDKSLESAIRWVQEAAELGAHRLGHAIALGVDPQEIGTHTRRETVAERRDQIAYDLKHRVNLEKAGVHLDPTALLAECSALRSRPEGDQIAIHYDAARLADVRRRQDYAMACIRTSKAVIEVCPTSNRRIGNIRNPAHHPVHRFLANGLPFVVCSDDPGMFGTTLARELDWVCEQTGGGETLRRHLIETAWKSRSECLAGRVAE